MFLALSNEINDLCCILENLSACFPYLHVDSVHEHTNIILHREILATLHKLHCTAKDLESWLSRLKIARGVNTGLRSDLPEWLRLGVQLHQLKDGLHTNRLRLGVLSDGLS